MKHCLLLGRKIEVLQNLKADLQNNLVKLHFGTSLDDVSNIMKAHDMDAVIMGAGLDLNLRLEVVAFVFNNSTSTSVHMKDWESGPAGMLPFVNNILISILANN